MMEFFKANLAKKLRSQRGILRQNRRKYFEVVRGHEEVVKKLKPALQEAAAKSRVDLVQKHYLELVEKVDATTTDILEIEKSVAIALWRSLKHKKDVKEYLTELLKYEKKASEDRRLLGTPGASKLLSQIGEFLQRIEREVQSRTEQEYKNLVETYRSVLRQQEGKEGIVQSHVLSMNELMKASDELWEMRGDTRKEKKEEKKVEKEGEKIEGDFHDLQKAKSEKVFSILKELLARVESLEKEIQEWEEEYGRTILEARRIITVCTGIYFRQLHPDMEYLEKALKNMREAGALEGDPFFGYPEAKRRELERALAKAQDDIKEEMGKTVDVVRREGRKFQSFKE